MYTYNAKVIKVIDGDTIKCIVDVGFSVSITEKFRLNAINCPENNTPEGKIATEFVTSLLLDKDVIINTYNKDKYGRWLCDVTLNQSNVNQMLIDKGYAKEYGR